jgi:hypothetical protein
LIISCLLLNAHSGAGEKGNKKMKAYPTMFMKTKENESDKWAYPTISMKTKGLSFRGHDVYEKKGT